MTYSSRRTCLQCGNVWAGDELPFCSRCLADGWENASGFIKPKHNPTLLPWPLPKKRSVVTYDFIIDKSLYINTIANDGDIYFDTYYNNFSSVLNQPLGMTAGSGIPPNFPMPTYPLDSQIVVDIFNNPHVYAENITIIDQEIAQGRLIPSGICDVPGCFNLTIPGTNKCGIH